MHKTSIISNRQMLLFIVAVGCLFSSFSQRSARENKHQITGYAQGTTYQITYFSPSALIQKSSVDSLLAVIDSSMSIYKPYSLISQFNKSEEGLALDADFCAVMKKALQISEETGGLFDVTVAPLVEAWGFGHTAIAHYPDSSEIASIKQCVGFKQLELRDNFLHKAKPCIQVDVNGIAQGYSVDKVAAYLENRGVESFIVEIGGELRIQGEKEDGSAMKIGIEGPSGNEEEPAIRHIVALNQGAITTSGNYRKFKKNGSQKISHLIDPRTGFPLDNELISVTLYAPDATTADGYDNAIMAMNLEDALHFVSARPALEAYIIYQDKQGNVLDTMTNGFKQLLVDGR
ncbi:FAD:protein FMN transferase [Olivibacter sp. XZL3]|uniref:FAD:protein FMN transferase n=1 Tax=Olivibacter sp. XZL3 TaxID=1735116 RepID=UPI001064AF44|nr:FAD:protein FMN transferase [Olivibacter sp. XZL3]